MSSTAPPESAVPASIGCWGCVGFLMGLSGWLYFKPAPILGMALILLATGLPMWWLEFRRFSVPPVLETVEPPRARFQWRLRGLLAAAIVWGVTLGLFQLASSGAVSGFWEAIFELWPLLLAAAVAYFCRQSPSTPHGLESLGKWLHEKPDTRFPLTVLRDQAVKAFFLPLMISFAYSWLARTDMKAIDSSFGWYLIPLAILYLVDTVFGTIGYLSTSQRVQAHIRSSDSTLSGWAVALSCYPPFFFWLESTGIVNYHSGHEWQYWLGKTGFLAYIWGGAILVLSAIYAWATVIFGIRFSNLTNRGIVTNGPFKYSKHPAYISKNISWWLMSMPFVSTAGVGAAAIHCGALLVVNLIYCLRAKTEERHLMSDANYRAYALWIAEHGLLAKLRNWFAPKRCVVVE